ncbi:MAG: helix-turn-helix transcriptional regulator [Erysipelothrix sp.]|nr:helix-turn-helix transcriptional regulator [Erysipelothrix sp.]
MHDNLKNNFRIIRKKVGITQAQLASFLELDQSSISKFEKGERPLEVSALEKACTLFGCTLRDLEENKLDNCLKLSFRKSDLTSESLEQIAIINKIALNLKEMDEIEGDLSA